MLTDLDFFLATFNGFHLNYFEVLAAFSVLAFFEPPHPSNKRPRSQLGHALVSDEDICDEVNVVSVDVGASSAWSSRRKEV